MLFEVHHEDWGESLTSLDLVSRGKRRHKLQQVRVEQILDSNVEIYDINVCRSWRDSSCFWPAFEEQSCLCFTGKNVHKPLHTQRLSCLDVEERVKFRASRLNRAKEAQSMFVLIHYEERTASWSCASANHGCREHHHNLPFCSWVMELNNGQKSVFVAHYYVTVKTTFDLWVI